MYLPNESQSILIIGKNGSGKSYAAVWHLAQKPLGEFPWVIINHKREKLIDSIPGAQFVDLDFTPKKPGVYVYHPLPDFDDDAVTALLWRIYQRENIGVYIDEGYMINPRDPALNALYTQGRSKHIPLITLSQRPSRISRFAISEAAFYQVFYLTDKNDRARISEFIPGGIEEYMKGKPGEARLMPDFHSIYYDVGRNEIAMMRPVPQEADILDIFEKKLKKPKRGVLHRLGFL